MNRTVARLMLVTTIVGAVAAVVLAAPRWSRGRLGAIPTAVVQRGVFVDYLQVRGEIRPVRSIVLTAPSSGTDMQIVGLAANGATVAPGDVVVEFDPTTQLRAIEQRRSEVKQAEAEIAKVETEARRRTQAADTELAQARSALERARLDVAGAELVPRVEAEKRALLLANAELQVAAVTRKVDGEQLVAAADVALARQKRDKAEFDLAEAERTMESLTLRAPAAGTIALLPNFRAGGPMAGSPPEFKRGDRVFFGAPIVELPDLTSVQMTSRLDEADRARVQSGAAGTGPRRCRSRSRAEGAHRQHRHDGPPRLLVISAGPQLRCGHRHRGRRSAPANRHERVGANRDEPDQRRHHGAGRVGIPGGQRYGRVRGGGRFGFAAYRDRAAARSRSGGHSVGGERRRTHFAARSHQRGAAMKRWTMFAVLAVLTALGVVVTWANVGPESQDIPTARVQRRSVQVTVHANGELRAMRSAQLIVPPAGSSLTIVSLAASGSAVKAGEVVVEFDPSEQEFALEQASFDLQLADQEIAKAEAEVAAQGAEDEVALLKARFDARRAELDASTNELVGAILGAQHKLLFDEARQRLAQLEVDVKSRRQAAVASRAVLQARRLKAQVAVDVARKNIENLQMRAPFDGFVTLRMNTMAFGGIIFSGAVMPEYRVGDTANPGQLIADLIDTSRVELTAKLAEYDRATISAGQSVRVSVDALPGAELQGSVRSVSGVASRQMFEGSAQRRFDIAIDVAGDTSRIRPGVSAALAISGPTFDEALTVPRSAVFEVAGNRSVYVQTAAGFEARQVKVVAFTESAAVIEGLEPDAEVALLNPNTAVGGKPAPSSPRGAS